MKKRLLSILTILCMVLTLLSTTAFAEEEEEKISVCSCETACTEENRNTDCPVCGEEGAGAESCGKYTAPATDEAVQVMAEEQQPENGDPDTEKPEEPAVQSADPGIDTPSADPEVDAQSVDPGIVSQSADFGYRSTGGSHSLQLRR